MGIYQHWKVHMIMLIMYLCISIMETAIMILHDFLACSDDMDEVHPHSHRDM